MDLQAIEARLKAATPGPWRASLLSDGVEYEDGSSWYRGGIYPDTKGAPPVTLTPGIDRRNAEFIAHAPDDIRALIDVVKAVRDAVARHPDVMECSEYSDDEPVSCGWKRAYEDVVWALNGGKE